MSRFLAVLAILALIVAGCGVERSSDDTLSADEAGTETDDQSTDGGEADDGGADDGETAEPSTTTTAPAAPPSTGPPDKVVLTAIFSDGTWEITHGELNEIVVPTQENMEFVSLVFGGTQPPGFAAGVLTEELISQALQFELDELGASISDTAFADSRELLLSQVETLYAGQDEAAAEAARLYDEVPYLPFLAEYQAGQDVLSSLLSEAAEPGEGSPCVSHILVETESEAEDVLVRLAGGEEFAALAVELSTGPSGPDGGDLGCVASSNYVPTFAEAVDNADLGEPAGPVETQFGWHVLVVDRYEVDGRAIAGERLRQRLSEASVEVDENLGTWDSEQLQVIPAGS